MLTQSVHCEANNELARKHGQSCSGFIVREASADYCSSVLKVGDDLHGLDTVGVTESPAIERQDRPPYARSKVSAPAFHEESPANWRSQ